MKDIGQVLICKNVIFYSENDEAAFFEWLGKIKCITRFEGARNKLYVHIAVGAVSKQELLELIALFFRYRIDMSQLQAFLTEENREWFYDNKKAYWHPQVFGDHSIAIKERI